MCDIKGLLESIDYSPRACFKNLLCVCLFWSADILPKKILAGEYLKTLAQMQDEEAEDEADNWFLCFVRGILHLDNEIIIIITHMYRLLSTENEQSVCRSWKWSQDIFLRRSCIRIAGAVFISTKQLWPLEGRPPLYLLPCRLLYDDHNRYSVFRKDETIQACMQCHTIGWILIYVLVCKRTFLYWLVGSGWIHQLDEPLCWHWSFQLSCCFYWIWWYAKVIEDQSKKSQVLIKVSFKVAKIIKELLIPTAT